MTNAATTVVDSDDQQPSTSWNSTGNATWTTDGDWSTIGDYFEMSVWIYACSATVILVCSVLRLLSSAFNARRRLFAVRAMIFVVAINRQASMYSLPADSLIKISDQQSKVSKRTTAVDDVVQQQQKASTFPLATLTTLSKKPTPSLAGGGKSYNQHPVKSKLQSPKTMSPPTSLPTKSSSPAESISQRDAAMAASKNPLKRGVTTTTGTTSVESATPR